MINKQGILTVLREAILPDIESGKIKSFFLVATKDGDLDSDYVSFCGHGDFYNLVGRIEKYKQEIILKITRSEDHN